jgi:hypothetical protein
MSEILYGRFKHMSGKRDSPDRLLFLDMVENPHNYKAYIVYLKEIDEDEILEPFDEAKTFYINEDGAWHTTDFHNKVFQE